MPVDLIKEVDPHALTRVTEWYIAYAEKVKQNPRLYEAVSETFASGEYTFLSFSDIRQLIKYSEDLVRLRGLVVDFILTTDDLTPANVEFLSGIVE